MRVSGPSARVAPAFFVSLSFFSGMPTSERSVAFLLPATVVSNTFAPGLQLLSFIFKSKPDLSTDALPPLPAALSTNRGWTPASPSIRFDLE